MTRQKVISMHPENRTVIVQSRKRKIYPARIVDGLKIPNVQPEWVDVTFDTGEALVIDFLEDDSPQTTLEQQRKEVLELGGDY